MTKDIFEQLESNVRYYGREFPATFIRASGATITADTGKTYIDFFSGAGALNYGHNNKYIQRRLIEYLERDGIVHALDMQTQAKAQFMARFTEAVLQPRGLDYKIQFCGPTGANAVEAAFKLARTIRKRPGVFAFTGAYHGLTLGSLAATSIRSKRQAAGLQLDGVSFMPFPSGFMDDLRTDEYVEAVLRDPCSGVDLPAAIIVETTQAEGGVYVAPTEWLRWLRDLCDRYQILLICDEIQVGCGRTGTFFSFERAGIVPDIVLLSKSISGYGGPMSILLMKPELDRWKPGEHTATFRGYQLAYVGATAALEYLQSHRVLEQVNRNAGIIEEFLLSELSPLAPEARYRGVGMIWGLDLESLGGADFASAVSSRCFEDGLIVERVGRNDSVLKILPSLVIEPELLRAGLDVLRSSLASCLASREVAHAG
jgi:diaminobutyrate-2-oxoglutarate transaminase